MVDTTEGRSGSLPHPAIDGCQKISTTTTVVVVLLHGFFSPGLLSGHYAAVFLASKPWNALHGLARTCVLAVRRGGGGEGFRTTSIGECRGECWPCSGGGTAPVHTTYSRTSVLRNEPRSCKQQRRQQQQQQQQQQHQQQHQHQHQQHQHQHQHQHQQQEEASTAPRTSAGFAALCEELPLLGPVVLVSEAPASSAKKARRAF
eukprot:COSAG06_NODE_8568_length_2127_cov_101.267751_2_plen_203_part_00